MCQTLFHIPETVFGLPLFGWGLLLGLLFSAIVVLHCCQYIRYRKMNDLGNSLALLGIGGVMLVYILPNLIEPGGIPIRGYGMCLLVAILAAGTLVVQLAKRQNIDPETAYSLCFWTVISGIIGARLFYVTEYWQEMLRFDSRGNVVPFDSLFNILNIAQGGLVVLGSVFGGVLGSYIFMRLKKMAVLPTFDILAAALPLGMAIGRIGCLLNGCCFGAVTDSSWGIVFPQGSPAHIHQIATGDVFHYGLKLKEKTLNGKKILAIAEVQPNSEADALALKPDMLLRSISNGQEGWEIRTCRDAAEMFTHWQQEFPAEKIRFDFFTDFPAVAKPFYLAPTPVMVLPVHPTQIYSSCLALLLCGILLLLGRLRFYQQRSGLVFASFMILYSAGRFMIEFVRTDEGSFLGTGLTVSQNISIFVCLAGVALFVCRCIKQSGNQVQ